MAVSIAPPYIFGASVTGSLHIQGGLPCQDAYLYELVSDDLGVIAVADGLGSVPLSDLGSRLSVEAAVDAAKSLLLHTSRDGIDLSEIPMKMMQAARESLDETALREGFQLNDMATTLIAVLFGKDCIYTAQIGDGAVVARVDGSLMLLSGPLNSEYANEVTPITCSSWQADLSSAEARSGAEFLAVFTDGCQRASLLKTSEGYEPFEKFFQPVFSFAAEIDDIEKGEQELKEFLASDKISEYSEDDKTLVLAVLHGQSDERTDSL
ncbi:MAG: protein phosphatase 2C domain-containing protein [Nitrospirae bacterium]|nr:protein phosphatase 2C domain-containing protein [Nitrospirota bacterium]